MTDNRPHRPAPITSGSPNGSDSRPPPPPCRPSRPRTAPCPRPPTTRPRPATSTTITAAVAALAPAFPHDAALPGAFWPWTSRRWADGGFRRARLPGLAAGLPAAAAARRRPAAPGGLPDVHPERQQQPPGRGRADRGHLARVHRRPGSRASTPTSSSSRSASWTSRPATTPTPPCFSRKPWPSARPPRSPGAPSSPTARPPGSAACSAPPRTSPHWSSRQDAADLLEDQELTAADLRHVGPHPRPHPHARRPAVRSRS